MDDLYYDDATSFGSLYCALHRCCNGVRWKPSVILSEQDALRRALRLGDELRDGSYRMSQYSVFEIWEPAHREIIAPSLRDRQFQRSLCDAGLYDDVVEHFIRDNYACQVGRGMDDALSRMRQQLIRFCRKNGPHGWVLKCDVRHFFASTPHDVAKAACAKRVSDPDALQALCDVIDSFVGYPGTSEEGGVRRGIGLGCQVDQLIELMVLDDMDHMIKERLGIRCYGRYMDDFVLVHESREHLERCLDEIRGYLDSIGLELNDKTSLSPLGGGFTFLKWRYRVTGTGKVLMLIDRDKPRRWRREMARAWEKEQAGMIADGSTRQKVQSWLADASRGDTYKVRVCLVAHYRTLTGDDFFDSPEQARKVRRGYRRSR